MTSAQREGALKFLDAAFDEALLLACGVVFGVLRQVAVFAGFGDVPDDARRSTVFSCLSSASSASKPRRVIGIFSIVIPQ